MTSLADDNAAVIRRGYEAFNSGDMETLTEIFDEGASWHTPGKSSLAGEHRGRDATFAYFGRLVGDTGGTFRATLEQLFTSEDGRVIGLHHNTGERDGKRLDVNCCLVFELEGGKVTMGREHFDDVHGWDEFWS